MQQWTTNRYEQVKGNVQTGRGSSFERGKTVLLIVLIVVLLGVGIAGGQAIAFRSRCERTFISRMQTECGDALDKATQLSRNGGADSAAVLGRIRANIHAVDTLNTLNTTLHGATGYIVPLDLFTELYQVIDSYSNKLKSGSVITEELTRLTSLLNTLQEYLAGAD